MSYVGAREARPPATGGRRRRKSEAEESNGRRGLDFSELEEEEERAF